MITSKQNEFVKKIRSLADKKNRDKFGIYLAEGVKPVREAFLSGQKVVALLGTEKGYNLLGDFSSPKNEILSEDVFKSISSEVSPQGIIAVIEKPINTLKDCSSSSILLDGVSDPANVGAIIRTAAASGYNTVYITEDSADPYSPKSVRASMSGVFRVEIISAKREELLKVISKPMLIADMDGQNLFETKIQGDYCLVIGNEGNGVSNLVRKSASIFVSIPMQNGVESLNASVSAGIIMYHLKNNK